MLNGVDRHGGARRGVVKRFLKLCRLARLSPPSPLPPLMSGPSTPRCRLRGSIAAQRPKLGDGSAGDLQQAGIRQSSEHGCCRGGEQVDERVGTEAVKQTYQSVAYERER